MLFPSVVCKGRSRGALTISLLLLMVAATLFTATIPVVSATMRNGYEIVFISHTYDEANETSTWTYDVTSGEGVSPAISYWIIAWCGGPDSIADASHEYTYHPPDKPDPTTGQFGIKFDYSFDEGATVRFWFQLHGDWAKGDRTVMIKAGGSKKQVIETRSVTGPVFTYTVQLETVMVENVGLKIIATATTDYHRTTSVTFKWYGPFSEEPPLDYEDEPVRTNTVTGAPFVDEMCDTPPENDEGNWWWLVKAHFEGGHPGDAADTSDSIHAPWFTSLPLTMLAAIGIYALRKKLASSARE